MDGQEIRRKEERVLGFLTPVPEHDLVAKSAHNGRMCLEIRSVRVLFEVHDAPQRQERARSSVFLGNILSFPDSSFPIFLPSDRQHRVRPWQSEVMMHIAKGPCPRDEGMFS